MRKGEKMNSRIRGGMLLAFYGGTMHQQWFELNRYLCMYCKKNFPSWVKLMEHWLDGECTKEGNEKAIP